jgi:type I restriction enzyme M protein
MSKLADLIWINAELLRGAFKENEYRKVILPFTILRRLDCVLQPTSEAVRAKYAAIKSISWPRKTVCMAWSRTLPKPTCETKTKTASPW